jgi:NAD(P)-dependent dehydrogenase (short-subunit alcohol dehydrogenase family)
VSNEADKVNQFYRKCCDGLGLTIGRMTGLAVVTGAASGIGRSTALTLEARGMTVIRADLDAADAADAADAVDAIDVADSTDARDAMEATDAREATGCRDATGSGIPYTVDVSDPEAMERFAAWVCAEYGAPDVLVNNAGVGVGGSFFDHTVADWRRVIDVNLMGVVHGCLFFGPAMVARGRGRIVNVASAAAYTPTRQLPAYGATKAGVLMLSQSLRAELRGSGVGVSAICPGFVATGIYRAARYAGMDASAEARRRELAERLALRLAPGPEVVAEAIVRAIEKDRPVVPVTVAARGAYLLSRVSPGAMRALARVGGADPFSLVERFSRRVSPSKRSPSQ